MDKMHAGKTKSSNILSKQRRVYHDIT